MITSSFASRMLSSMPFSHFVAGEALDPESSLELLTWLETHAPWKLVEADFYEQYEFSVFDESVPSEIRDSLCSDVGHAIRAIVQDSFDAQLSSKYHLTFHKLVAGQRIRIHNDFIPGAETHRVLIQLNRGWTDSMGGMLMLFASPEPSDVTLLLRPAHNSCVAFEISPRSFHAVSQIHGGERYTMVISFSRDDERD